MLMKEKKDQLFAFGNKLAGMRKAHHMTQMQLADLLGVDNRQISRYENGAAEMGALLYDQMLGALTDEKQDQQTFDLLEQWRTLTPKNRQQLLSLASMMNMAQKSTQQ